MVCILHYVQCQISQTDFYVCSMFRLRKLRRSEPGIREIVPNLLVLCAFLTSPNCVLQFSVLSARSISFLIGQRPHNAQGRQ